MPPRSHHCLTLNLLLTPDRSQRQPCLLHDYVLQQTLANQKMWFTIISLLDHGPTLQSCNRTKFSQIGKFPLMVCTGVLFPCLRWSQGANTTTNTVIILRELLPPTTTLRTLWFAAWRGQTVRLCQQARSIECLT